MKTNQPQPQKTEKTRLEYATARAIEELARGPSGGKDLPEIVRGVAFDLLRSYQLDRVAIYAADAPKNTLDPSPQDEEAFETFIHESADSMAIYTADNLATLIGSENWEAMADETGEDMPNFAALAYHANAADLRRFLSAQGA